MWNLLGERPVDACYWESFGKGWKEDTVKHLGLKNTRDFTADYGMLPDLEKTNPDHDILFTFNGTTSGVRVPNLDWISDNRQVKHSHSWHYEHILSIRYEQKQSMATIPIPQPPFSPDRRSQSPL